MGGHYEDSLHAVARHVEGVSGQQVATRAVDPEAAPVDRLFPGGRGCGDEAHEALGQQALPVPDAVAQVEKPQPRPVAGGAVVEAGKDEVASEVGLEDLPADPDPIEEHPLGPAEVVLATRLDDPTHDGSQRQGITVAVAPDATRRMLRGARQREAEDVLDTGVDPQVVRNAEEQRVDQRLARAGKVEPAAHAQEVRDGDLPARIARRLPFGDRCGSVEREGTLLDQAANQGRRQALAHGPALELGVAMDPGRVALRCDPSTVHDQEGGGVIAGIGEGELDRLGQLARVDPSGRRPGQPVVPVSHWPCLGARIRKGASHLHRDEGDVVHARRQGDAALVAVVAGPPVDQPCDLDAHLAPPLVHPHRHRRRLEGKAVRPRLLQRAARDEDRGAENLGVDAARRCEESMEPQPKEAGQSQQRDGGEMRTLHPATVYHPGGRGARIQGAASKSPCYQPIPRSEISQPAPGGELDGESGVRTETGR